MEPVGRYCSRLMAMEVAGFFLIFEFDDMNLRSVSSCLHGFRMKISVQRRAPPVQAIVALLL